MSETINELNIAKRTRALGKTERIIADLPNNELPEAVLESTLQSTIKKFVLYNVQKLKRSAWHTWKVREYGDLDESFTSRITTGNSKVSGRVMFNFYGRFVDMGVGKGKTLIESQTGRALTSSRNPNRITRNPKPWFTEVMSRERHRLAEVVAENVAEATTASVAKALPEGRLEINV